MDHQEKMNYKSKDIRIARVTNSVTVSVSHSEKWKYCYAEVVEQCLLSQCQQGFLDIHNVKEKNLIFHM